MFVRKNTDRSDQEQQMGYVMSPFSNRLMYATPDFIQITQSGAYNVRYEILKKRIDKAYIEGIRDRLTQEGKIAIVYLHRENQQEYLEYLDYMVQKGLIEPEIEEFNLARMQGLKALRVQVRGLEPA